jgi:hypothetical protein
MPSSHASACGAKTGLTLKEIQMYKTMVVTKADYNKGLYPGYTAYKTVDALHYGIISKLPSY